MSSADRPSPVETNPGVDTGLLASIVRTRLFDAAPHRIGRFAVLERLGAGGMGVVYAAFDAELDRRVAIKLLFDGVDDGGRLAREAQVMARLNHPNVAQIYEVGRHEDATYVAMEHVRGRTLRTWVTQSSPTLPERLSALVQAGRGLASAHAAGVIHRDFKPDNVMMGDDGRVRVLDFGLARDLDGDELLVSSEASPSQLESGEAVARSIGSGAGTPAYMAPEQWRGDGIDARADVYSFCVTAWELLSGERPFPEASLQQLRRDGGAEREVATSSALPRWIERVLRRGLAADREHRHASIDAVLVELSRDPANTRRRLLVLGGVAATITGVLVWQRATVLQRERACASEAASIAEIWTPSPADEIAASFAGTGLAWAPDAFARVRRRIDAFAAAWSTVRETVCLGDDRKARETATACLDDARTQAQVLLDRLAAPTREVAQLAVSAAVALPDPGNCADPRAAVLHVDRSTLPSEDRKRLIEIHVMYETAAFDEALVAADALIDAAASTIAAAPVQLVKGSVLRELGRHPESREAFEIAFYDAGAGGDDVTAMRAAIQLVYTVGFRLAQAERGQEWARAARMYIARLGLADDSAVAGLESNVGMLLRNAGEGDGSLNAHRRALEIRERIFGPNDPAVATSLAHVGFALADRGDIDGGVAALRRALEIQENTFGPDHPEVARVLKALGEWLMQRGEYDEAQASLQRALAIEEAVLGTDHETVADTLIALASVDLAFGRHASALAHDKRALEIVEASFSEGHPRIAAALTSLGHAYEESGDSDTARRHYEQSIAIQEKALGPDDGSLVAPVGNLGILLLNSDDPEGAAKLLQRADEISIKQFGRDNADRAIMLGALASAQTSLKRPEAALALLEEALDIMLRAGLAPAARADIEFQIGRALLNLDRDHERALTLAKSAESSWRAMGPQMAEYADAAIALIGALEKQRDEAEP